MTNQTTFKKWVLRLYLAYSLTSETIIIGGAVYYFFLTQGGLLMDEDEWGGFGHPDEDRFDDLDREIWSDEDRQQERSRHQQAAFFMQKQTLAPGLI